MGSRHPEQIAFVEPEDVFGPEVLEEPEADDPPTLGETALHGLAGDAVRSLAPHSEADPAALLLQFLAAFGNLAGPGPQAMVGSTRHGLNLFVVLVGETSKARKGTSWRQIAELFAAVDPAWAQHQVSTTRPAPSNILKTLRDQQPATDRRLLILAEEFASVLGVLGRRSGQLSQFLRCAWDGGDLCASDGHNPVRASAAHISMVGHITESELAWHIGHNESHDGFANRCLWTSVHRSQSLPEGGRLSPDQSAALVRELDRATQWAKNQAELVFRRSDDARDLWNDCYPGLSESRPDVYGAATSRAEAQVLRLSALYAALDSSVLVETCHLHAALAVWEYCQASARIFFNNAPIDPAARRIQEALTSNPGGLSKTQMRGLFHGHITVERIDLALEQLSTLGLISPRVEAGRGRSATLWAAHRAQPTS